MSLLVLIHSGSGGPITPPTPTALLMPLTGAVTLVYSSVASTVVATGTVDPQSLLSGSVLTA